MVDSINKISYFVNFGYAKTKLNHRFTCHLKPKEYNINKYQVVSYILERIGKNYVETML